MPTTRKTGGLALSLPYSDAACQQARLGSCARAERILLNVKLIQAPTPLIDYVILHELRHLKEHQHNSTFPTLLDTGQLYRFNDTSPGT